MPVRHLDLAPGYYRLDAIPSKFDLQHLCGKVYYIRETTRAEADYRPGEPRLLRNFAAYTVERGNKPPTKVYFNTWVVLHKRRRRPVCNCLAYSFPHHRGKGNCPYGPRTE